MSKTLIAVKKFLQKSKEETVKDSIRHDLPFMIGYALYTPANERAIP